MIQLFKSANSCDINIIHSEIPPNRYTHMFVSDNAFHVTIGHMYVQLTSLNDN